MIERFISSMVEAGSSFGWLLFDTKRRALVDPVCDYADAMIVKAQLGRLTVEQEMGYLRVFWNFLANEGGGKISCVNDVFLRGFRARTYEKALTAPAHRGSREAAKLTTNAKLVRVYDWLRWMRDTGRSHPTLIGAQNCQVLSTLARSSVSSAKRSADRGDDPYPLLFRLKAGSSKHRLAKFIPTEDSLDAVIAFFHSQHGSPHVVHRNCAIASMASYTGFRRASIQSLRTAQFVGTEFELTEWETVLLKPDRQKFGYGDTFEIPQWLHEQIKSFIRDYRCAAIARTRAAAAVHRDIVFVSDRDGRPLTDRALTAIMSQALRSVGATKGSAMHAWRAKFAVEETAEAYLDRTRLGLDTSIATMDAVVARKLGHNDPTSARAYTSAHEAAEVACQRARRENERHADKNRIWQLEARLAELEGPSDRTKRPAESDRHSR